MRRLHLSKTNPTPVLATWTFDPGLLPALEVTSGTAEPNTLRVAQVILAAIEPYPDAYQAMLIALRQLPLPGLETTPPSHPNR